jgi:hypothetical protein
MKSLFAPRLPAEIERAERERIARKTPHLALVVKDPRPEPNMYVWRSVADLVPVNGEDR